jgi:hypothetical protein
MSSDDAWLAWLGSRLFGKPSRFMSLKPIERRFCQLSIIDVVCYPQ